MYSSFGSITGTPQKYVGLVIILSRRACFFPENYFKILQGCVIFALCILHLHFIYSWKMKQYRCMLGCIKEIKNKINKNHHSFVVSNSTKISAWKNPLKYFI